MRFEANAKANAKAKAKEAGAILIKNIFWEMIFQLECVHLNYEI